jgi:hypothetical protein
MNATINIEELEKHLSDTDVCKFWLALEKPGVLVSSDGEVCDTLKTLRDANRGDDD